MDYGKYQYDEKKKTKVAKARTQTTELKNVQALRARRSARLRHAPTPEETWQLLKTVRSNASFATSLAVRLLYGCEDNMGWSGWEEFRNLTPNDKTN